MDEGKEDLKYDMRLVTMKQKLTQWIKEGYDTLSKQKIYNAWGYWIVPKGLDFDG
eukprot:gene7910-5850_t